MNHPTFPEDSLANASREEIMAALFAHMVIQHTNMAMLMLGKVPHPETGEKMADLEAAKMFVDQLEMLEFKTKGNLGKQEDGLLKQSLMAARLAFVEAMEAQASEASPAPAAPAEKLENQPASPEAVKPIVESAASAADEESRKRFSKKY